MTTQQLSRMLARHLAIDDPANLSGDAAFEVLQAINAGIQWFYTEAPATLKRTTFSNTFQAPLATTLTFADQYSTELEGSPFQTDWFGCGLRIPGIEPDNEIAGLSSVLDQWPSPTLTTDATVLFDTAIIPATIERITSEVRAYSASGFAYSLKQDSSLLTDRRSDLRPIEAGRPLYFRISPVGISAGGIISFLMRIYPAPATDVVVRFEAETSAATVSFSDLSRGADVPIADAWSSMLIPLCESQLSYSPFWKNDATKDGVRARAESTIATRIKKLAQNFACPDNRVMTPHGY